MAGFQQIGEREVASDVVEHPAARPAPKSAPDSGMAFNALMLALKSLSQRTLVALSNMFTLVALGSGFWLWYTVLPSPTPNQLIGAAGASAFILALEFIRRR